MTRIGIKYCGGCSPRYDRIGCLKKFMQEHPEFKYQTVNDGNEADYWLIVCGCGSACAETGGLTAAKQMIKLDSAESFEKLTALFSAENGRG